MDVKLAKRVVAIKRQMAVYMAMEKKGELFRAECAALVSELGKELDNIRRQQELMLPPGEPAPQAAADTVRVPKSR